MSPSHDPHRSIQHFWTADDWLGQRMLFLSGPRQVGKTTLVVQTLCPDPAAYLNWDHRQVRRRYQQDPDFISTLTTTWLCCDEIHKRPRWKDILKGWYDTYKTRFRFVVTGSARLETFRRSGDSLVGRYFHTHLFPLNLPDLRPYDTRLPASATTLLDTAMDTSPPDGMETLLQCSGFPEPFFTGREAFWKRWSANHFDLILREDLHDLSRIVELDKIAHLVELLRPTAGQLVSLRSLAADLETTHASIRRWLEMLQRLHLLFPVPPYARKIRRAYTAAKKWYFTDWCAAGSARFENYVAASLDRAATLWTDRTGDRFTLHFVRTHDGAEVDFLLCRDGAPWLLIEAKEGGAEPTSATYRFSHELRVPCAIVTRRMSVGRRMTGPDRQRLYLLPWARLGAQLL